jgi:hypothetical protein
MDLSTLSDAELVPLYGELIAELKKRGIIHSKNVVGDLGEHLVCEFYRSNSGLPNLVLADPNTKNVDALGYDGMRYTIKTTTTQRTSAIRDVAEGEAAFEQLPRFEYLVIAKLDDSYQLEKIVQLDWPTFLKHRVFNKHINGHILGLTDSLLSDATIVYERS